MKNVIRVPRILDRSLARPTLWLKRPITPRYPKLLYSIHWWSYAHLPAFTVREYIFSTNFWARPFHAYVLSRMHVYETIWITRRGCLNQRQRRRLLHPRSGLSRLNDAFSSQAVRTRRYIFICAAPAHTTETMVHRPLNFSTARFSGAVANSTGAAPPAPTPHRRSRHFFLLCFSFNYDPGQPDCPREHSRIFCRICSSRCAFLSPSLFLSLVPSLSLCKIRECIRPPPLLVRLLASLISASWIIENSNGQKIRKLQMDRKKKRNINKWN